MEQSRHQYVTRVPSSSLLGFEWLAQLSPDIPQYGMISLATICVNKALQGKFLDVLYDEARKLPSNIAWLVAEFQEDPRTWILLQTSYRKSGCIDNTNQISESSPTSVSTAATNEAVTSVRRLASGISVPFFKSRTSEEVLVRFLGKVTDFFCIPPSLQHSRMVVAPCGFKHFFVGDTEVQTTVLQETVCAKSGRQSELISSCEAFQLSLSRSTRSDEDYLMTLEVHQDLDTSVEGRVFEIFYYFDRIVDSESVCDDEVWKRWRQSLQPIIEAGSAKLMWYKKLFDSRTSSSVDEPLQFSSEYDDSVISKTPDIFMSSLVAADSRADSTTTDTTEVSTQEFVPRKEKIDISLYDPRLTDYIDHIKDRKAVYTELKKKVLALPVDGQKVQSLRDLKNIHEYFGIHHLGANKWIVREWIPGVEQVFLMSDFNHWSRDNTPFSLEDFSKFGPDVWKIVIDHPDFHHLSKTKLHIVTKDHGSHDRVLPSSNLVWKDHDSEIRNSIAWDEKVQEAFKSKNARPRIPENLKIYEAYVGLAHGIKQFGTYNSFRQNVLPRLKKLGYNTLLLIGVSEHSMTTLGWHVTNFLATTSAFGSPTELKMLIDAAHGMGICVLASVVHCHTAPTVGHGLAEFNGTESGYTLAGNRGKHRVWDVALFDYACPQVCRFLLSQLSKFYADYNFDGFRFEGVTSMLYHHHGIGKYMDPQDDLSQYFSYDTDKDAIAYIMMANEFIHSLNEQGSLSIASEYTYMPILTIGLDLGGFGFDYCMSAQPALQWSKLLSCSDDHQWSIEALRHALEYRPANQKTIVYAENWDTITRSRRPLLIAMFAWESLYTHAVGGVAPHVTELAAGLARLGHQVHVYVRATGASTAHNVHYGVHYHECPFNLDPRFVQEMINMCNSFIWHMEQTEKFLEKKFDICHAHDWLAAKAMVLAKQSGHTCIQTIHSTEFGRCGNKSYGGESAKIANIEREACHIADRVICVSGVLSGEACHMYSLSSQKIAVIYNGINAQNFDGFEDAAPIKAKYGIQPLDPMFLFVGRLATQKGPDLLVEAIPFILKFRNDTKFVFVGDGYSKNELINRTRDLRVDGSCRFLGTQTGATLKSLFKACDAVVVPSRNEPFGIVVLEAWSAYKPVVATTCGGPRDFVSPTIDGILVDPNPHSIAWGCCEILKNFEHARWMGQRGRVKAAFNFSWDHTAKTTENVYWEQLNKHDSPYSESGSPGDCSLALRLAGSKIYHHLGIFDNEGEIHRFMSLHKMIRLLTCGLGAQGYLNFMGNEFGHPDCVDLPRPGNQYSFTHTNRRFDLPDDKLLKFKHLEFFDACMIRLESALRWLSCSDQYVLIKDESEKVLAFERGDCLFIANLHPTNSYTGYQVHHSLGINLRIILDTDEQRFGGFDHLKPGHLDSFPNIQSDHSQDPFVFFKSMYCIKVYLPSRTAMVLVPEAAVTSSVENFCRHDPVFSCQDADQYINMNFEE